MKITIILCIFAMLFCLTLATQASATTTVGPLVLNTFKGETMGGVGVHMLPLHSDKQDVWGHLARRATMSVLAVGNSLEATRAFVGLGLTITAPQGKVVGGVTYIPEKKCGALYMGYSIPL